MWASSFSSIHVMEFASMGLVMNICNVLFFISLFIWGVTNIITNKKSGQKSRLTTNVSWFSIITIVSTSIITFSHMGYIVYKLLNHELVTYELMITTSTWCLASIVGVYSLVTRAKSPVVVIVFWCVSLVLDSVSVTLMVLNNNMDVFRSVTNIIDMGNLALTIILCFNGVSYFYFVTKYDKDLEEPLIQESGEECDAFTNAGIWEKVTFNWLGPLFETGRAQKLEFVHVPSIPESETAEEAALLLEESIQKQKTGGAVSPKAIIHAIRGPLAINAVFAGKLLSFYYI